MSLQAELEEFLTYIGVEKGLSRNTISSYKRDLNSYIQTLDSVDDISVTQLENYVASLRAQGLAESSIARAVVAIRNFVDFHFKEIKKINPIMDFTQIGRAHV